MAMRTLNGSGFVLFKPRAIEQNISPALLTFAFGVHIKTYCRTDYRFFENAASNAA